MLDRTVTAGRPSSFDGDWSPAKDENTMSYDNVTGLGFHVRDVEKELARLQELVENTNEKIVLLDARIQKLEQQRIEAK